MKIFIATPGHLRTVPMGKYCAETFREMGHDVHLFDSGSLTLTEKVLFRPLAKIRGKKRLEKVWLNDRLKESVTEFKPDLFLAIFGFDLFPDTLKMIRNQGIRTACWWLNDPFQFERGLMHVSHYDSFLSNCEATAERYRKAGHSNAGFLPHAAFTGVHRPVSLSSTERRRFESEVCFVGDWGPVRQGILSLLSQRVDLKIWGPWKKHLSPKDRLWSRVVDGYFTPETMASIFSSTKIAINLHSWFGYYTSGFNPRTFETPGCGALQICDWKEGLDRQFLPDDEIVIYQNGFELEWRIKELLKDDALRQRIASSGLRRVERDHTYVRRMRQLLTLTGVLP